MICILPGVGSVKPRVTTSQSSVNFPKAHLKRAQNSANHYKTQVMRAVSDYCRGVVHTLQVDPLQCHPDPSANVPVHPTLMRSEVSVPC